MEKMRKCRQKAVEPSFVRADRCKTAVELNIIQKNGAVLLLAACRTFNSDRLLGAFHPVQETTGVTTIAARGPIREPENRIGASPYFPNDYFVS
jgi:hypothetical protein